MKGLEKNTKKIEDTNRDDKQKNDEQDPTNNTKSDMQNTQAQALALKTTSCHLKSPKMR